MSTPCAPSRCRAIALLFDRLSSEYALHLRRAVERAAARRGTSLLVVAGQCVGAPSVLERTQNRIYRILSSERVDGIITVSATLGHYCGPHGMGELIRGYAPLPVCSVGVAIDGVPSLVVDNAGGMETGVAHLLEVHRCRRIAFIGAQTGSVESDERLQGYRAAYGRRGLAVDEQLIAHGEFTMQSGAAAMRTLLARRIVFDSVVAANDDMALGALDVLAVHGFQVPRDTLVCGFDDIHSAHLARPSLSTLRQPMWWLGEQALDAILAQLDGQPAPARRAGLVEFVRRESCGCGYQLSLDLPSDGLTFPRLRDAVRARRADLERQARESVLIPNEALGDWPSRLLDALEEELAGYEGRFSSVFEEILARAQDEGASLDEFQRVVSVLRSAMRRSAIEDATDAFRVEQIWHSARVLVGAASIRTEGRVRLDTERVTQALGRTGERLAVTLSLPLLKAALAEELPRFQIRRAAISLVAGHDPQGDAPLIPFLAMVDGQLVDVPETPFPATRLAPDVVLPAHGCHQSVVMPLTFEGDWLGVMVLEAGALPSVYESLRQQIGSSIKSAQMHRQVVAHVANRERLEQLQLAEEAKLAGEIQTSIAPVRLDVLGLEIACLMRPAAQAGGDYYDILPTDSGAWLAVGDVAGHGLAAGLIMLMVQSMIAVLSRLSPELTPSRLVSVVNRAIHENVRIRLKRDDHATLLVLRYDRGGRIVFAGAHDYPVIWRARTQRCETVVPTGFWVGAIPDIAHITRDQELRLAKGDLLVLYTDGATEPRNAQGEQYGIERLMAAVESTAHRPVSAIRDQIVDEVQRWGSVLDDDITVLVARQTE